MSKNKSIFYQLMIIIIILSLVFPSFFIPAIANSSDYSLSDAEIKLDGTNDGEVEIDLVTETGGTFYALDGRWDLSENETTNYFSLSELKAGGTAEPIENSVSTGKVYWTDSSFTGFNVASKGKIWTAKYKVNKDTPSGTYTIGLKIDTITGGTAGYNSDENILLNTTVKVTRIENSQEEVKKPTREITPIEDMIIKYGDTKVFTEVEGVTYTSNNENIVTIDSSNKLSAVGTGEAIITVTYEETPQYAETIDSFNVTVEKAELTINNATVSNKKYDGKIDANVTNLSFDGVVEGDTLEADTDYTVDAKFNNANVGENKDVQLSVKLKGNVANNYKFTNNIYNTKANITAKEITPVIEKIQDLVYNGEEQKPELLVKDGETILKENIDYTVVYSENIDVGTATATIKKTDNGNYKFESIDKTFKILPYTIKDVDVSLEYTAVRYNGEAKEPKVTVKADNKEISKSKYSVEYSKNTEIGIADVIVTANDNNYTGKVTKHFEIQDKEILVISGIENNKKITYTGKKVKLVGEPKVLGEKVSPNDLKINWYNEDGEEIDQPIEVGSYIATYSYLDEDYIGSLSINFEITKAKSILSDEITNLKAIEGDSLSTIELPIVGLNWKYGTEKILAGNNKYTAIYTKNNDTTNYTTETIQINIYGYSYIDISTNVNGIGGSVSDSLKNVLEGTKHEIIFTPEEIYEIDTVTVNGKETKVTDNKLVLTAGTEDLSIVVTYKKIGYKYIEGANQTYTIDKDKTATFRIDAEFTLFKCIYMDGKLVDPSNYTVKSGSTIITFSEEYLESLGEGTHTMTAQYSNGVEAETVFSIAKANEEPKKSISPKTGDNIIIYMILAMASVLGIIVLIIYKRKKHQEKNDL